MGGKGVWRWGKREIIYLSLQNDSCIKMGNGESHFNVSLIVRDKVTRQCLQTTTFFKKKESRSGIEPRPHSAGEILFVIVFIDLEPSVLMIKG